MKKYTKFSLVGAALLTGTLSSCNEQLEIVATTSTEATTEQFLNQVLPQYTAAFEKQFGQMDPTHDWGMDEEIGAIEALSDHGTRAGEVVINRNQWTEFESKRVEKFPNYGTNTPDVLVPNFRSTALGHDIQIPGFPHLNGLYYVANGNTLDPDYKTGETVTSGMIPAGDVTPYEIQYVSNWFRTHKNPKSNVKLHLSDFFIQNVSCDFDQVEYRENTDNVTPYATGWEMTGNNGKNITTIAEANAHKAWDGSTYATNLREPISYELDYLGFEDMDGNWTHVNNFNRGNSNFSPEDNESNPNRMIMYIKSSGTENFSCRPSWCTDLPNDTISTWVLVRLTWVETVKHSNSPYDIGTQIPREGYYLAFDFHGAKQNSAGLQTIKRDGYYSNWIVKITPGHFNPVGRSRRIFCEDLGGTFDYDFDDAVVDVAFESVTGGYQPIISVQAAGGTMPIYIEQTGDKYELHKLLEADGLTPVNVDATQQHPVAIYRGNTVTGSNPGQIKIIVDNTTTTPAIRYQVSGTNADSEGNERTETLVEGSYTNKEQLAPLAFSAPTSVKWMKETMHIDAAYKDFPQWVKSKTWTGANGAKWYQNVTNGANLLYTPIFKTEDDNPTGGGTTGADAPLDWTELVPDPNAATTVAAVNADSYMKLNGYSGDDAITPRLAEMDENDRVTFVVVLSSAEEFKEGSNPLKGTLIPADINGTTTTYNSTEFTPAVMSRFNDAALVPENEDFAGENTYTLQFSFSKADIINTTHTGDGVSPWHDYLLLYLKVGDYDPGTGTHGVTVQKWYVHY